MVSIGYDNTVLSKRLLKSGKRGNIATMLKGPAEKKHEQSDNQAGRKQVDCFTRLSIPLKLEVKPIVNARNNPSLHRKHVCTVTSRIILLFAFVFSYKYVLLTWGSV